MTSVWRSALAVLRSACAFASVVLCSAAVAACGPSDAAEEQEGAQGAGDSAAAGGPSKLPAGCAPDEVAELVDSTFRAISDADYTALEDLFAPGYAPDFVEGSTKAPLSDEYEFKLSTKAPLSDEVEFKWYSDGLAGSGVTLRSYIGKEDFVRHIDWRHEQREQLRLISLDVMPDSDKKAAVSGNLIVVRRGGRYRRRHHAWKVRRQLYKQKSFSDCDWRLRSCRGHDLHPVPSARLVELAAEPATCLRVQRRLH